MKRLNRPHAKQCMLQRAQPACTRLRSGALLRMTAGLAFVLGLLAVSLAIPAHAQSLDLSGKSVTLAIATPSGGGYDLYGRMVARHIGRYLPGNPTVVPQN